MASLLGIRGWVKRLYGYKSPVSVNFIMENQGLPFPVVFPEDNDAHVGNKATAFRSLVGNMACRRELFATRCGIISAGPLGPHGERRPRQERWRKR